MPQVRVELIRPAVDGQWLFREAESRPVWRTEVFGQLATFDPFPAYPHDVADVQRAVDRVTGRVAPLWDVTLLVADREEIGRSNGFSNSRQHGHYEGDTWVQDPPVGVIVLSGKRIPPHPALTAYLVAHEYGHQIELMVAHARGAALHSDTILTDYAQARGLPVPAHHGEGGRWHDSAGEIFACDFRIMICGVEVGYWPHPGIPRPEDVTGLGSWWAAALADLEQARTPPSADPSDTG